MAIALTLSQIVELSGGRPRKMKLLADEGVFRPIDEERASRAARSFPLSEAAIACIVAALDRWEIKIGTLASFAEWLRDAYQVPSDFGFRSIEEAHKRDMRDLLLGTRKDKYETPKQKQELLEAYGLDQWPTGKPDLDHDQRNRIRIWIALEEARAGKLHRLLVSFDDDGGWQASIDAPPQDEPESYIVLRLDRILDALRA